MHETHEGARRRAVAGALACAAIVGAGARLVARYRRDLDAARRRLALVDRKVITTEFGDLEYAEEGAGDPVLMIHGFFQGSDSAILSAHGLVTARRVIGPSRFGYLDSSLPRDATPAMQADAFAALLSQLHIDQIDVIAVSAGTTSAIQLALRHPERVRHLVIVSGNWPGSPTAVVQPPIARHTYAGPPMWALRTFAPTLLTRLMGVPSDLPRSDDDAEQLDALMDSIFPVEPRIAGCLFDGFVSNADVNSYPLEEVTVPTLILHAPDDTLASYDAAVLAATRIPEATFVHIESGGHLLLGQGDRVRAEISAFLSPAQVR